MPFYDQLVAATEPNRREFLNIPILAKGVRGQISRDTYLAFLGQAYHHVRHTVPLLMACGARLCGDMEWLRGAVANYIQEEIGHEQWILDDIAAAGGSPDHAAAAHPHAATELMIAYAYDSVHRGNPLAFFGMVLVLEGTSVALATKAASAIQQALRLPDEAFSYLRSHGALDQEHMKHFAALMNRLQQPSDQHDVIHAARMFYQLYGDMFRSLPSNHSDERNAA
jgi:pyrroloquinoline quinone (PQQ) biosynthesis protein C